MRALAAVSALLVTVLMSTAALANGGGVAGYTGKPTSFAPQGESCSQCHNGGTAPQVSIAGPSTLAAGQSGDYTLIVKTGETRAGAGVAATDGVVLTAGTGGGFRDSFGEMVQDGSKAVSGGQATFSFRVTAPLTGTTLRLWAVGLAANGSGTGGDSAAQITQDVSVTGGAPATPPSTSSSSGASGSSGTSSSGSSGGSPASSSGTSGATTSGTANTPNADGSGSATADDGDGSGRVRSSGPEAGSCAMTRMSTAASRNEGRKEGKGESQIPMLALAAGGALLVLASRRRRR